MQRLNRLKPYLHILAGLVIIAIAWILRWRGVTSLPIDYDEDDYLRAGQQYAALFRAADWPGFTQINYRPEHPPLNKIVFGISLLNAPETKLVPDRATTADPASTLPPRQLRATRTTSAVLGTLEVALLALVNPLGGLLLGLHTFTIKYTSQAMLEGLPAFTSLAAVLCYVRAKRSWRGKGLRFNGWLAGSSIFLGLTAASKYLYVIVGLAIMLDWLRSTVRNERKAILGWLGRAVLWGLLALLFFFLADPYLWPDPLGRLQESLLFHGQYATSAQEVQQAGYPVWQPLVWLATSVPWHSGVFIFMLDGLIAILAVFGMRRLWQRESVYVLWLLIGLSFLFIWPTKWPQYILLLTAPLALAAAEGMQALAFQPLHAWWKGRKFKHRETIVRHTHRGAHIKRALPWLVPGLVAFGLLTLFPLLFQLAMAMTDFTNISIRDGLTGGIWRELWMGLTGQTQPATLGGFQSISSARQVHWVGLALIRELLQQLGGEILVFEIIWTVLSVCLQTVLGLGMALILWQRGIHLRKWWQVIFILPWAIPETVGAIMWSQILEPKFGWLVLARASFPQRMDFPLPVNFQVPWQENPNAALLVMLLVNIWYGFPFMFLAASAGLKLLPPDIYESASLDGANGWQTFRLITWPLLMPLVIPAIIIRSIFAFNQFYLFQVLSPPWPVITLATISFWLLGEAGQYAVSAGLNIVTVLILIGFVLIFNRTTKAGEGVTYA